MEQHCYISNVNVRLAVAELVETVEDNEMALSKFLFHGKMSLSRSNLISLPWKTFSSTELSTRMGPICLPTLY